MIKDPFGNEVIIQDEIFRAVQEKSSDEILDDITTVIEKPAMMFKMNAGRAQLYYMRAVGWNKMMLIIAQKKQDHFEVTNCEIDPSAKRLSDLYHWADQLL